MLSLLRLPQSCSGDGVSLCRRKTEPLVVTPSPSAPETICPMNQITPLLWVGRLGQHRAINALSYFLHPTLHCCHSALQSVQLTRCQGTLKPLYPAAGKASLESVCSVTQLCVTGEVTASGLTSLFWRNGRITLFWRRRESLRGGARRKEGEESASPWSLTVLLL